MLADGIQMRNHIPVLTYGTNDSETNQHDGGKIKITTKKIQKTGDLFDGVNAQ